MMLIGAAGCARTFPPVQSRFEIAEAEFQMPPKQLLQSARRIISDQPLALGIEREGKGWFITGYQRFPGEWHIGRRWQERTQYRIAVIPDFDDPASRARLQVTEQTQQRASNVQDWKPANELNRPERADALLRELEKRLRDQAAATVPDQLSGAIAARQPALPRRVTSEYATLDAASRPTAAKAVASIEMLQFFRFALVGFPASPVEEVEGPGCALLLFSAR